MPYNILTCSGFAEGAGGWVASSSCTKGRLGLVLLFFIIALIRKWGGEEIGLSFSFLLALLGGILPYFIVITLLGSFKIAFMIGLGGALAGGYLGGMMMGGEE